MAAASSSSAPGLPSETIPRTATHIVNFPLLPASSYVGFSPLPAGRLPGEQCEFLLHGCGLRRTKYDRQYGFVSLGPAQFQRESCRIYNHEILSGESGAHNFYICSHATHVQLWGAQCTSWHGVAEPGGAAWHGVAEPGVVPKPTTGRLRCGWSVPLGRPYIGHRKMV